jgi:GTP-binding protein
VPAAPSIDSPADDDSAAALETGRLLFARPCAFVASAATLDSLPDPSLPEIAFAGRSNVGKSSLVNALTGRTALARTSNTPGRTQAINFFNLADALILVDLPGYGYARAAKAKVRDWTELVHAYLRGRPTLRRLCLLIDARHGAKEHDRELMAMLDGAAVSFQSVLTKVDKIAAGERAATIASLAAVLAAHPAAHPAVLATSARSGSGIAELRAALAVLAAPAALR